MTRLKILNDFAFQKALGEKGDEPQLLSFLNAVLERTGKNNLESVEILEDKDLPAEIIGSKSGKLDVLAKLPDGSKVNVEVQIKNQHNIEKRSLFYWSRKYIWDLRSGENYIDLVPVIGINIIDFGYGPIEDFHTSYHLWEDRHKDILLTDVCEIHFLDMVKFRRTRERNLEAPLYRWLIYFDEHSPEDLIEEVVKMDSAIQLVQDKLDMIARDPELFRAYEKYEKAELDRLNEISGTRLDIARRMKARGRPLKEIAEDTDLDVESLKKL
jgi:predicted transposase/invertase (TIGR01784 family)